MVNPINYGMWFYHAAYIVVAVWFVCAFLSAAVQIYFGVGELAQKVSLDYW